MLANPLEYASRFLLISGMKEEKNGLSWNTFT